MNPIDAAYHVVHDYPGGAEALAPRLGKAASTLSHEVRPGESTAKLGLADAVRISELADDLRILQAFAARLGCACVRTQFPAASGDLLAAVSRFAKETGDALLAMHKAIEDGRITDNEIRAFEREVADIAPAALALVGQMRAAREGQRIRRAA